MKRLMVLAVAALALMGAKSRKDAYVISIDNNSCFNTSVEECLSMRKRLPTRSIWVRRNGAQYLIVDESLLRQVSALFAPVRALEPEQRRVGREEHELDREIDRLSDRDELSPAERRRLSELEARMKIVSRREQELDEREEELEREAERAFWPLVDEAIGNGLAVSFRAAKTARNPAQ